MENLEYWQKSKIDDQRRDWQTGENNWVEEYWASKDHPHRKMIIEALKKFEPFESVLEVGCNAGPNLALIGENYPDTELVGVEPNADALTLAMKKLPNAKFIWGSISDLWFVEDSSFDVVIADAVLMYVEDVEHDLSIMGSIAKKGIILVDWKAKENDSEILYGYYARNYKFYLKTFTKFSKVEETKITKELWPNERWSEVGYLWTATEK